MVTEVLDVKFRGVIVNSGFVGAGRVNGGWGGGPKAVENGESEFSNVKVCVVASIYLQVFVQCNVPIFTIRVLGSGGSENGGIYVGNSYSIWFKY